VDNAIIPADLLHKLMDGAFENPLWCSFLDRLRDLTGADYASLIFRQPAPSASTLVHLYSGAASPPLIERLYRERLHQRDPVSYRQLVEGQLYATDDLLRHGHPVHDAYRRDLLEPSGMNVLRLMRVVEPGGMDVWLSLSRADGEFSPQTDSLIESLAPYVRSALRSFVALERERFKAAVATEGMHRLNFGWFTLDKRGHVLDADSQATRFLDQSTLLRRGARGRLMARIPELDHEIAQAVRAIVVDPGGPPRALVLQRDPWLDMLLVPFQRRSIAPGPAPALIAYVHSDSSSSADRTARIGELFALLPSEARTALALSRGVTFTEAAAELGLTVETVRHYSKKIYAKTGAKGQPDLVRIIHRSVLAFG
jgi:DNA-binding CsgD family transcriptional regulator